MSTKSSHRVDKSRRRVAMAAGAILAGAVIPLAAAGTAWADETETVEQLVKQGLSQADAQAVVDAQNNGTPVQVSYDRKVVVDDNQGSGSTDEATARSGAKDVSAAIGGGSDSTASGAGAVAVADGSSKDGNSIDATARGLNSTAWISDSTDTKVTATYNGAAALAYGDTGVTATATGFNAEAQAVNDSNTKLSDIGTYSYGWAEDFNNSTAKAYGAGTYVSGEFSSTNSAGVNGGDSISVTGFGAAATSDDDTGVKLTAVGPNAAAVSQDSIDSTATARFSGPYSQIYSGNITGAYLNGAEGSNATATGTGSHAEVDYATGSTATASGMNSQAWVQGTNPGTGGEPAVADADPTYNVSDSAAAAKNGGIAMVQNDGNATVTVTGDAAIADKLGSNALVLDSNTSSLTVNNGESYSVTDQTGVHVTNMSVPAEMTPLTEVHEMHPMPLPLP
jgi:hypothetical protein